MNPVRTILLNGERRETAARSLIELLAELERDGCPGIAVALNAHVISRSLWEGTVLDENDVVEIVEAAQGG